MAHRSSTRAHGAAAVALASLLGVAACQPGTDPAPSPPGDETTTTMPSPTSTDDPSAPTTDPSVPVPDTTAPTTETTSATPDTTAPPDTTATTVDDAPAPEGPDGHPEGWELVFADEFDGDELDRDRWCTRYVYGGGGYLQDGFEDDECGRGGNGTLDTLRGEAEVYRDLNQLGEPLHVLRDGHLELSATETASEYHRGYGIDYESAMIRSKEEFVPTDDAPLYLVARIRMPDVHGTWPAFWLNPGFGDGGELGWPPEIDIVEGPLNNVGEGPDTFFVNSHGVGANGLASGGSATFSSIDEDLFDARWHHYLGDGSIRDTWLTVGLTWESDSLCWSVVPDGGQRVDFACQEDFRWVHDDGSAANPASILLNLGIGGWGSNHDNSTLDPADYPGFDSGEDVTSFDIDYVRVYEG
ncbi:MAG: glycoside hydrolase family 16 protein [Actinomycetota bacterium]|nr:glycoside hydrolase family 16 protein [Actinomycetota bacterium]